MTPKTLRVLLAETGTKEVSQLLHQAFPEGEIQLALNTVSTVADLQDSVQRTDSEVVLLDLAVLGPDSSGTLRSLVRSFGDLPLIVFLDPADRDAGEQYLSEGVAACLAKDPTNAAAVGKALRATVERNALVGLADLLRDPLTGLYIREGFLALGARALETTRMRNGNTIVVCALLENLADLRAEFGPSPAEQAVNDVATVLTTSLRRTDVIARIGEAQFSALIVDAAEPSAAILRQRLESHVAMKNRDRGPWGTLKVRLSTEWSRVGDERTFPELLDCAERQLRAPWTGSH